MSDKRKEEAREAIEFIQDSMKRLGTNEVTIVLGKKGDAPNFRDSLPNDCHFGLALCDFIESWTDGEYIVDRFK